MISHKHKFIFVHINRTGGTSIEKALRDFGGIGNSDRDGYKRHDLSKSLSKVTRGDDLIVPTESAERKSGRRAAVEMTSSEEAEKFARLGPIDPLEIRSCNLDELCRMLLIGS